MTEVCLWGVKVGVAGEGSGARLSVSARIDRLMSSVIHGPQALSRQWQTVIHWPRVFTS